VNLPVVPPLLPMLAKKVSALPEGEGWLFEPKWDGFRVLVFRDGDELFIQSRDGKPLDRYFPEMREPLLRQLPARCVLDGELVIAGDGALDFDALQLRLHPAASRVKLLAGQMPASIVFWDVLCVDDSDLRDTPFADRRARLEKLLANAEPPLHLTPATSDRALASDWFSRFEGAGLDGVMAKQEQGTYQPNKRVMLKVKHERECDCVVAGFRWHKSGPIVGSLLLGLYNDAGDLQHIGVAASFPMARRAELVEELAPYRAEALHGHPWQDWANAQVEGDDERRMPGATSRWNAGKDLSWVPLRPELVVEIRYDQLEGSRLRHTGQFQRWRTDREARSCTYDQLEVPVKYDLAEVLGG
jgi:ATP-dependent DNA ligase